MQKVRMITKQITAKLMETGFFFLSFAAPVMAQVPGEIQEGADRARPTGATGNLESTFRTITNTIIFIVGAIAVLMLIVGGLRYVISAGDREAVEGAKNTILYAVIGIVVAILAFAIVDFVLDRLGG